MKTDDWAAAKSKNDFKASNRIIALLWNNKKTEQLKKIFPDPENVIFISQPTTSGFNVLPNQFAEKLSSEFKTDSILGDDHARARHFEMSKNISFPKRAFHPREYKIVEVKALKEAIGDKEVCLVDDVMTSGGSVASFTKALNREGIEIKSIAALTGERRLNIDDKTHDRLEQTLKAKNININIQDLTNALTRTEAGGIIMTANSAKSEAAIEILKTNLENRIQYEQNQGYDQKLDLQQKPEKDPNLPVTSPKLDTNLSLPRLNTAYINEWDHALDKAQNLLDREHAKENPQEQEKHHEQLKQPEQEFEKEPQLELGR